MRGLDHDESAQMLIDGKRFYYNFIRPHMALNDKTPAEAAGINQNLGENRWLTLIQNASMSNPKAIMLNQSEDKGRPKKDVHKYLVRTNNPDPHDHGRYLKQPKN